ncbi:MAG TPA: hypothetical protein VIM79_28240 [Niastella sp.]
MNDQVLTRIIKSTLTLFLLCISTVLSAQITVDGKPGDWPAVLNGNVASAAKTFIHDATNTNDDQFTQGSQDDNVLPTKWHWNNGSTNDKGDIQNTGVALIGSMLYFFGDRTAINGTAQIGFWFFLNDVFPKPDGTFNADHKAANLSANPPQYGDLLILSNFINGGGTVDIRIYTFTGYSGGKATFQLLSAATAPAKAVVNTAVETVPNNVTNWSYQSKGGAAGSYVIGSYFEGSVDLSKLGNLCFQQFLMETRNSAELSASQQDMAAGDFDVLPSVTLSATLKTGLTKSNTTSAACPQLYILDALKTTTAAVTATTTAQTTTFAFSYSNGNSVPTSEATFTPSGKTGTFEVKSVDAFGKTYRIIVTASNGLNCDDKDTICINVTGSAPPCTITGPNPVCPKSTNTYIYNPDGQNGADALPTGFTAKWTLENNTNGATPGATDNTNSFSVTAAAACEKEYTVKLALTSATGFGNTSCTLKVDVKVNSELTLSDPADKDIACGASTNPSNTGTASAPDNGCGVKLMYIDTVYRTWVAIDACGNKKETKQVIRIDTCVVTNTLPARQSTNETLTSGPVLLTNPVNTVNNGSFKSAIRDKVTDPKTTSPATTLTRELQVQAFPNPFSNTVNFRFVSPVSGRAILEIFNSQGQRVGIAFDGKVDAGSFKSVQFSTRLTNQTLIYKLKVGDKSVRGSILELKR